MRKFIVILMAVFMIAFGTNVWAGALEDVNLGTTAGPIVSDSSETNGSLFPTWFGNSSGGAIGGAASNLDAAGGVLFGTAYINDQLDPATANSGAGALSESFETGGGFIGPNGTVGTNASAFGWVSNNLSVGVQGLGLVGGTFNAITGEGTAVQAGIINIGFDATFGHTDIQAAQGGIGGYEGFAGAALYGDAHADAYLNIAGQSNVVSGRNGAFVLNNGIQEGLWSAGYVATTVISDVNIDRSCLATAGVEGGWIAGGFLDMDAQQVGVFQPSSANAEASGSYSGSGSMGQDYYGNATGGVATQITQYPNAVISLSSGYMSVTSTSHAPQPE